MAGVMRSDGPVRSVTRRERQISELIAHGLTNREIAGRLTLSVRTVEGHIYRAQIKLDVATRHELARALWGDRLHHIRKIACHSCPYASVSGAAASAAERLGKKVQRAAG